MSWEGSYAERLKGKWACSSQTSPCGTSLPSQGVHCELYVSNDGEWRTRPYHAETVHKNECIEHGDNMMTWRRAEDEGGARKEDECRGAWKDDECTNDRTHERVVQAQSQDAAMSRRIIVVGDVHGCLAELDQLLDVCKYNPRNGDLLVSVGDVVNKVCMTLLCVCMFVYVCASKEWRSSGDVVSEVCM